MMSKSKQLLSDKTGIAQETIPHYIYFSFSKKHVLIVLSILIVVYVLIVFTTTAKHCFNYDQSRFN